MRYLDLDQALRIHEWMIRKYGGSPELLDLGRLESALETPKQTMFGDDLYPDLASKAAALLYLLVKNHPFADGNKRTGFMCLARFVAMNDYVLDATNDELYQITMDVATSFLEKEQVTEWIRAHLRSVS